METLVTEHEAQLQKLPIYALGVSSGGSLALYLPKVMQLTGICSQIMAIYPEELENILLVSKKTEQNQFKYPPTIFMHMPQDVHTATYINKDAEMLQTQNIPVAVMQTGPRPLTPNFLARHSDGQISHNLAVNIVNALRHHKLLDAQGMLMKDPRQSREEWVNAVERVTENFISLEANKSPLMTLMNVAFAQHDIITSGLDSALKWLESGGQGDLVKWVTEEERAEALAEGRS
jgi:hypothetical protein